MRVYKHMDMRLSESRKVESEHESITRPLLKSCDTNKRSELTSLFSWATAGPQLDWALTIRNNGVDDNHGLTWDQLCSSSKTGSVRESRLPHFASHMF